MPLLRSPCSGKNGLKVIIGAGKVADLTAQNQGGRK